MTDDFVNSVMVQLSGKLDDDSMRYVRDAIMSVSSMYNIEKACTDIIEYEYSLPECYKMFMVSKRLDGKLKDTTANIYRKYLEDMLYHIGLPVEKINTNHIRRYIAETSVNTRTGEHISKSTQNNKKCIIRSFFQWLKEEGYIEEDPTTRIRPESVSTKPEEIFTDFQIETIRRACTKNRDIAMIDLMVTSGMRVSELVSVNINDINYSDNSIIVCGKGEKYRKVYFDGRTLSSITTYLKERTDSNEALFVSENAPHQRIKTVTVRKILKAIESKTGITNIHPHRFRHTMASRAVSKGCDIVAVQKFLGHSDVKTTMRYTHIDDYSVMVSHKKYVG